MAPASYSPFVGPMFEIVAGPDHKCFLVHASILVKSDKLKAIVEGDWKERAERKITLEEWDEETVGRLVEWLYTGDYNSPCPTKHAPSAATIKAGTQGAEDEHDVIGAAPATAEKFLFSYDALLGPRSSPNANKKPVLTDEHRPRPLTHLADQLFDGVTHKRQKSSIESFEYWKVFSKQAPHQLDFEVTLLAHAKVYVLANYMLVPDLQALAFQHLQSVFLWIDSHIAKSPAVLNLVTLIRYVYANTNRPNSGEEPLRKHPTTLIATNFSDFNDGEEGSVRGLIDEGGDFMVDVWEKISRHMGPFQEGARTSLKRDREGGEGSGDEDEQRGGERKNQAVKGGFTKRFFQNKTNRGEYGRTQPQSQDFL